MNLDIGSVIGGRYRLTRHIAAGGMGRFLLNNPNFIGAANSRGERRY